MATQDQIRQVAEDAVDSANNYITLMEGSPNEKTFLLESPGNPTANDLKKINNLDIVKKLTNNYSTIELESIKFS